MMGTRSQGHQPYRRGGVPNWLLTGLVILFLAVVLYVAYFLYATVRNFVANQQIVEWSNPPVRPVSTGVVNAETTPIPTPQVWSGKERVNILVLGIDQREVETDEGPWRTDTMIVLTLDPVSMTAGMLSIPRDLYVPIPGYERQLGSNQRINTAHYYGDLFGYPGGGPALAKRTVEYNLGIPIHFYVRLNFTAFERLVDEIGGIDIYVPETINDPDYPDEGYGYDPFYIEAGWHHLDGKTALKYARTRATFGGDFDRAKRQQQVILAIRDRVLDLGLLPQLIAKAPQLLQTLGNAVQTDMTLEQAQQLAWLAAQVDRDRIQSAVLDNYYTIPYETPDGQQVLVPIREKMRELRDTLFAEAPLPVSQDPLARLAQEGGRIVVENGTQTAGLARRTSEYLQARGFQVVSIRDANELRADTVIIDHTGKPFTVSYLAQVLGVPASRIFSDTGSNAEADIELILGADFRLPEG